MKTYYSNINKFNEEIEDFVIAKNKIEKPLIENEEIEKKMTITEFISYINLKNNVYCTNDEDKSVIPFEIKKPNKEELVIIYSSIASDNINNEFKKELEKIDFDLSKLNKISELDILNGTIDLTTRNYFILNGDFYC